MTLEYLLDSYVAAYLHPHKCLGDSHSILNSPKFELHGVIRHVGVVWCGEMNVYLSHVSLFVNVVSLRNVRVCFMM